ncbi:MAG: expansin (peptidoglycan-binding protein) [Myxococcota bacterium]
MPIIDSCPIASNPICVSGHLDLSRAAFQALGEDLVTGVFDIEWQRVEAPVSEVSGGVEVFVKDGSNPFHVELQIQNHLNPIATIEGRTAGSSDAFTELARQDYNFFVDATGLGATAEVRVTDIFGNQVTLEVAITGGTSTQADDQFPTCGG